MMNESSPIMLLFMFFILRGNVPEYFPNSNVLSECYPDPLASTNMTRIVSEKWRKVVWIEKRKREEKREGRKK